MPTNFWSFAYIIIKGSKMRHPVVQCMGQWEFLLPLASLTHDKTRVIQEEWRKLMIQHLNKIAL